MTQISQRHRLTEAIVWLQAVLSVAPLPVAAVEQLAQEVGIRPRTLQRARSALNVRSTPDGWQGQRVLSLPPENQHSTEMPNGAPGPAAAAAGARGAERPAEPSRITPRRAVLKRLPARS